MRTRSWVLKRVKSVKLEAFLSKRFTVEWGALDFSRGPDADCTWDALTFLVIILGAEKCSSYCTKSGSK